MEQQTLPPGFRFSPTDEELVGYYLKNRVNGKVFHHGIIAELDIYKFEPWELRGRSALPSLDPVWYFFNAQDQKHSRTVRINRTTNHGYWKATGKDRKICSGPHTVGTKKTLIYYQGRAPNGIRTDWIMHEYKLSEDIKRKANDGFVPTLCRIRKKSGPGPRNGEQYGAPVTCENEDDDDDNDNDNDNDNDGEQHFGLTTQTVPDDVEEKPQKLLTINEEVPPAFQASREGLINDRSTESEIDNNLFLISEDNESSYLISNGDILGDPAADDSNDLELFFQELDREKMMMGVPASGVIDDQQWIPHNEMNGDFIELNDMKRPLDGFHPRSPFQNVDLFDHWLPSNTVEDVQSWTSHRMRLQVGVSSGQENIGEMPSCSINVLPKLEPEEVVRKPLCDYSQNSAHPASVGTWNSSPIGGVSTTTSFIAKHESSFTVSVRKEASPPLSCSLIEGSVGMFNETEETTIPNEETCSDCEEGLITTHHHKESEAKRTKNSLKSRLKCKLGSLATKMRQFENNVCRKLNERLYRVGKQAHIFFVEDHMNPVNFMRRGLVSLIYLLTALLVSMLLYLGFHIFT